MTEEQAIHRVIEVLRKQQPGADWSVNDLGRLPNIGMVIRIVLALKDEK